MQPFKMNNPRLIALCSALVLIATSYGAAEASDLEAQAPPDDNPGALAMFQYVPAKIANAPLVVILHGCSQSADDYATRAGWQTVAD
tara:strand:+ start:10217 stop:10477 length:261 start_codon:yes stop_codon:yes gene_type:complete